MVAIVVVSIVVSLIFLIRFVSDTLFFVTAGFAFPFDVVSASVQVAGILLASVGSVVFAVVTFPLPLRAVIVVILLSPWSLFILLLCRM